MIILAITQEGMEAVKSARQSLLALVTTVARVWRGDRI
jgi:hypothetical protein